MYGIHAYHDFGRGYPFAAAEIVGSRYLKQVSAAAIGSFGLSDVAHCFEIFVDDFIGAAVPHTKEDLNHLSRALLHAIHDLFPPCPNEPEEDPVSLKKLRKLEGAWMVQKDILGWTFDGKNKTMELEEDKLQKLMATTKSALRAKQGVRFEEFRKMTGKMRHASMGVPGTNGLFSPFNRVLGQEPSYVWFRERHELTKALRD